MDANQLKHIFFPHTERQTKAIQTQGLRLAYYTSAATAASVIRNGELWMRNTSTMNDYSEVEHGFDCVKKALGEAEGKEFRKAVDDIFPGLSEQAIERFDGWLPHIRQDTYITCVSEHLSHEDAHGRLSMWRAYGGNSGVAFVFKPDALFKPEDLGVYASPVAYWTEQQVRQEFSLIAERIREHLDVVRAAGAEVVESALFNMLMFGILGIKHPGFAEEREWRIVSCPPLHKSHLLRQTVEVVRGTPQLVQRIQLRDDPEHDIQGVTLKALLDRIIIGPCEYPDATYKAMMQLLKDAGFESPGKLIHVSDIPLRVPSV